MKKTLMTAALSLTALFSAGCMTTQMWENATEGHTVYEKTAMGHDTIYAFGQAQQNTQQIRSGSLVMMGQRYWYVLPPHASQKFVRLLKAGLPRAYVITTQNNAGYNVMPVETLPQKGQFSSQFCLNYTATNAQEKQTLTNLRFSHIGETYRSCFNVKGQYYNAANSVPAEHQFEAPISVALSQQMAKRTATNPLQVGGALLLTPLTLAGDTLASILILPSVMATYR